MMFLIDMGKIIVVNLVSVYSLKIWSRSMVAGL